MSQKKPKRSKKPKRKKPTKKVGRPDPFDVAKAGEALAKRRIESAPGYGDLADFSVMVYTDEELDDLDVPKDERNWVGQYSRGSVDSDRGAVVLVNATAHVKLVDESVDPESSLADTLCHEMGHALWELLDDEARDLWRKSQAEHRWGAEEAFADDFMFLVSRRRWDMNDEALFMEITSKGAENPGGDEELRSLERAFASSGSADDEARLMVKLLRVGQIRPDHLTFLAELGDRAAGLATGVNALVLPDARRYDGLLLTRQPVLESRHDWGQVLMGLMTFAGLEAIREHEQMPVMSVTPRLRQLRRGLQWLSESLANGYWNRDWHAVADAHLIPAGAGDPGMVTDVGAAMLVHERSSENQALALNVFLDMALHRPQRDWWGPATIESERNFPREMHENLLRRAKPYVMAGSPETWDTGWTWSGV